MERDAECVNIEAVQQDYLSKSHALTSCTKDSLNFNRMLVDC
jgi:hypothetical protein